MKACCSIDLAFRKASCVVFWRIIKLWWGFLCGKRGVGRSSVFYYLSFCCKIQVMVLCDLSQKQILRQNVSNFDGSPISATWTVNYLQSFMWTISLLFTPGVFFPIAFLIILIFYKNLTRHPFHKRMCGSDMREKGHKVRNKLWNAL